MGRSLRILVAPNAFKGSLTVLEAARAMARGAKRAYPDAEVLLLPISDGGDGLIDALLTARGGRRVHVSVRGPLGEKRQAPYGRLDERTAVVEMALASGLALVPPDKRDPLGATSFGTGQLIDAALRAGAKKLLVGLGGSATNDGGAGLAQALGYSLKDARGTELAPGVEALLELARIEPPPGLRLRLKGVKVYAVTDVTNPLLGPEGSARVYGPQKGASPAQVAVIERALGRLATVVKRDLGADVGTLAGGGAAGGLGAGLVAFLGARIEPGAAFVLKEMKAAKALSLAQAVVTGEGRLDRTSFFGKAPIALARLAREAGVPAAGVFGAVDESARALLAAEGLRSVVTLGEAGAKGEDAMASAAKWAARAAAKAVKALALAALALLINGLGAVRAGATDVDWASIDKLYFSRQESGNLERTLERLEPLAREKDPQALWRLGRSLVRAGERAKKKKDKLALYERAESALAEAVALAPKDPEIRFWRGVAMGRRGQTKGMMSSLGIVKPLRREMEAVLALDPGHGGAHRVLGEMLLQLPGFAGGDKKEGLAELEKAVELSPRHTANYVPLAEAYAKAGRKDDARRVLERLLKVSEPADPAQAPGDLKDGKKLLESLKR